jgi:hypothetical protein
MASCSSHPHSLPSNPDLYYLKVVNKRCASIQSDITVMVDANFISMWPFQFAAWVFLEHCNCRVVIVAQIILGHGLLSSHIGCNHEGSKSVSTRGGRRKGKSDEAGGRRRTGR